MRPAPNPDLEALRLAADGLTAAEIGAKLFRTEGNVKSHLLGWRIKLKARNTAHAVSLAHTTGLFGGPVPPGPCEQCQQVRRLLVVNVPMRRHLAPLTPPATFYDRLAALYPPRETL